MGSSLLRPLLIAFALSAALAAHPSALPIEVSASADILGGGLFHSRTRLTLGDSVLQVSLRLEGLENDRSVVWLSAPFIVIGHLRPIALLEEVRSPLSGLTDGAPDPRDGVLAAAPDDGSSSPLGAAAALLSGRIRPFFLHAPEFTAAGAAWFSDASGRAPVSAMLTAVSTEGDAWGPSWFVDAVLPDQSLILGSVRFRMPGVRPASVTSVSASLPSVTRAGIALRHVSDMEAGPVDIHVGAAWVTEQFITLGRGLSDDTFALNAALTLNTAGGIIARGTADYRLDRPPGRPAPYRGSALSGTAAIVVPIGPWEWETGCEASLRYDGSGYPSRKGGADTKLSYNGKRGEPSFELGFGIRRDEYGETRLRAQTVLSMGPIRVTVKGETDGEGRPSGEVGAVYEVELGGVEYRLRGGVVLPAGGKPAPRLSVSWIWTGQTERSSLDVSK